MKTATRALSALTAPVLVAGLALAVSGAPASAAPGSTAPSPYSACQALGGQLDDYGDGSWECSYAAQAGAERYDPSLVAVCGTTPSAYILDNGLVVPTIDFYCPPALIS
jgi:hypothetical protein